MRNLKENKRNFLFTYLDFLKSKEKIQIDGSTGPVEINTIEGLADIHPEAEHLEIGDTEIPDIADVSRMDRLKVFMMYQNPILKSINGLKGLELNNLTLMDLKNFNKLGEVDIKTKKVVFANCPNFEPSLDGINDVEELDITMCGTLKDLTFLKGRDIRKIDFRETSVDSLYGIQYSPSTQLSFKNMKQENNSFEYHRLFYDNYKLDIKDYWKEIVSYWMDVIEKGKTSLLDLPAEEIKDTFIKGIKLPVEEIERLFNEEEQRYLKSVMGINKYNL